METNIMGRGIGHVGRAIEAAFTENPSAAISTNYLISKAYPGEPGTKPRRVAVIRAADKVAKRLGWSKVRLSRQGGQLVYGAAENEYAVRGAVSRGETVVI